MKKVEINLYDLRVRIYWDENKAFWNTNSKMSTGDEMISLRKQIQVHCQGADVKQWVIFSTFFL